MSSVDIIAAGSRLFSDRISRSLAAGASVTYDVEVSGTNWLTVWGKLAAGSADADLAVTVAPFEDDNVTLSSFTIAPGAPTAGPTNTAGTVRFFGQYNVIGFGRVRITWTNNNAGTKTVSGSWRTQGF